MESNNNINNPFLGFVNPNESDNMYPVNVLPHAALPENLLDEFTRLNVSAYSPQSHDNNIIHGGHGSFLGIDNNNYRQPVLDSSRVLLDSPTDMQRMRVEAALRAQSQMQRNMLYLQGSSNNINCVNNSGYLCHGIPSTMTNSFQAPAISLNRNNDFASYLAANNNVYNGRYNLDSLFMCDYLMNNRDGFVSTNNNVNNGVSANNNFRNHRPSTIQREQMFGYSSVEEVRGSIYKLSKDQTGCKFLGDKIEKGKPEDINIIFVEIKDHVRDLMVDQIGNLVIQKLFEFCNQEQMNKMLTAVIGDSRKLLSMCLDMHGYVFSNYILFC